MPGNIEAGGRSAENSGGNLRQIQVGHHLKSSLYAEDIDC